jgi:methylthioribose-1-phosphate isomerase
MKIDGIPHRSVAVLPGRAGIRIIDQRLLPFELRFVELRDPQTVFTAIREMWLRGAPLIGAAAAFGLALAARHDASDAALHSAVERLRAARPTAVNLAWALERVLAATLRAAPDHRADAAWAEAEALAEEDVAVNAAIGRHGLDLLQRAIELRAACGRPVDADHPLQLLTHCNAGWLATVDWGTATAPIYLAHEQGLPLHVWVDETRPRNQGAGLTAWELGQAGVPHTLVADNAGGHLMQHGQVDLVIVGCDRVSARGDVCNKIGTYLKALAAHDNGVPFVVAMPTSTLDRGLEDGLAEIPIEDRSSREQTHVAGRDAEGRIVEVQISAPGSPAANPAFDVTPARLVTALLTEHGVVAPERAALAELPLAGASRAGARQAGA